MGFKKFIKGIKDAAEKSLKDDQDPEIQRERMAKNTKRAMNVGQAAIKGAKQIQETSKKAREKTAELADKMEPMADKIDQKASELADQASDAAETAKETLGKWGKGLGDKFNDAKNAYQERQERIDAEEKKQPSTGSSIADWISPAVPETKNTKPKSGQNNQGPKKPS